jgi:hypothetical protein
VHNEGVIHLDIKPPNLFLSLPVFDGSPHLKLLDFGVSLKPEGEGTATFFHGPEGGLSEPYAAPEQLAWFDDRTGGVVKLTMAADVFGLAATAWYAFTALAPFSPECHKAIKDRGHDLHPDQTDRTSLTFEMPSIRTLREDIPAPIASLLARALARSPAVRLQNAQVFLHEWELAWKGGTHTHPFEVHVDPGLGTSAGSTVSMPAVVGLHETDPSTLRVVGVATATEHADSLAPERTSTPRGHPGPDMSGPPPSGNATSTLHLAGEGAASTSASSAAGEGGESGLSPVSMTDAIGAMGRDGLSTGTDDGQAGTLPLLVAPIFDMSAGHEDRPPTGDLYATHAATGRLPAHGPTRSTLLKAALAGMLVMLIAMVAESVEWPPHSWWTQHPTRDREMGGGPPDASRRRAGRGSTSSAAPVQQSAVYGASLTQRESLQASPGGEKELPRSDDPVVFPGTRSPTERVGSPTPPFPGSPGRPANPGRSSLPVTQSTAIVGSVAEAADQSASPARQGGTGFHGESSRPGISVARSPSLPRPSGSSTAVLGAQPKPRPAEQMTEERSRARQVQRPAQRSTALRTGEYSSRSPYLLGAPVPVNALTERFTRYRADVLRDIALADLRAARGEFSAARLPLQHHLEELDSTRWDRRDQSAAGALQRAVREKLEDVQKVCARALIGAVRASQAHSDEMRCG